MTITESLIEFKKSDSTKTKGKSRGNKDGPKKNGNEKPPTIEKSTKDGDKKRKVYMFLM